jgi:hypothetical protein
MAAVLHAVANTGKASEEEEETKLGEETAEANRRTPYFN